MTEEQCIVCGSVKNGDKFVVKDPSFTLISELISKVKTLYDGGYAEYKAFIDSVSGLSEDEKKAIRYHRT